MFGIRKSKRKGLTLIYVLFIGSVCIFISIICFKISYMQRNNVLKMKDHCCMVDPVQKIREYMLTDLNNLIYSHCNDINDNSIKEYISSLDDNIVNYERSYIKYNSANDSFIVVYYVGKDFYKEELYKYIVRDNEVFFNCLDYSFRKGEFD
ncbi:hypothetical protein D4Z93_08730 [Clostridium fermenticellae]|uniref:Uncharacterized protein n=1 Tax=Clostridium fermenticellae TaxID=2068654 RepID=A0A386H4X1_9CLOT|nr:hypothetical protein [Clostridium fermenticellae]AYD40608.1 hypothetical protein D4Z93_08730 [Clostridium fermenticellae]